MAPRRESQPGAPEAPVERQLVVEHAMDASVRETCSSHAHAAVTASSIQAEQDGVGPGSEAVDEEPVGMILIDHQRVDPTLVVHGAPVRGGQIPVPARIRDPRVEVELHPKGLEVIDLRCPVDVALHVGGGVAPRPGAPGGARWCDPTPTCPGSSARRAPAGPQAAAGGSASAGSRPRRTRAPRSQARRQRLKAARSGAVIATTAMRLTVRLSARQRIPA